MHPDEIGGAATETELLEAMAVKDPDGETAEFGPVPPISSGLGGLGLEGIVGNISLGEGTMPLGEGSRGLVSGAKSGVGDSGAAGSNAGAAEMVEIFSSVRGEDRDLMAVAVKKTTMAN